jgi:hypothetical protein
MRARGVIRNKGLRNLVGQDFIDSSDADKRIREICFIEYGGDKFLKRQPL